MRLNLRLPVSNDIQRVLPQIPIGAAKSCNGAAMQSINIDFAVVLDSHIGHIANRFAWGSFARCGHFNLSKFPFETRFDVP